MYTGPRFWNNIPKEKKTKSFLVFRTTYKKTWWIKWCSSVSLFNALRSANRFF